MRPRGLWGRIGRIRLIQERPVLAATLATVLTLGLIGAVVFITPVHCGPAKALGLKGLVNGCYGATGVAGIRPTPTPQAQSSAPYNNPASGPLGYPASAAFPPQGNPASPSGSYPPFYPPASYGNSVSTMALNCRLPVYAGGPGSGGFIVFPGGTFVADPSSSVVLPSPSGATAPPQNGPGYGPNSPGLSYDRAYARWLPVPPMWVSPDGKHYAYTQSDGLYAVSVASGSQAELREGGGWWIVGVQNDGVYAGNANAGGLWSFPYSGSARQITSTGYWQAATSTAAYGTTTSAVPQGATNAILRLDLATGKTVDWFTRPETQSSVAGFDGKGNPILNVRYNNNSGNELWIASGPSNAQAIAGYAVGYYASGFSTSGTPVADSHGLWLAGSWSSPGTNATGVVLYVAGSGLYWMSSIGGQLAGGCS